MEQGLQLNHVPIGRPIDNMHCLVLKADGEFANYGEEGELLLAGPGVFKGYLGQPELTEQAIYRDSESGLVYYRSGDHVRVLHDGSIEYLERIDNQIKINGFRIELEEISRLAEQHVTVNQAVSIYDKSCGNLVLCVATGAEGFEANQGEITQLLEQNLPNYMVPSQVLPLKELPTLSNGKIDRKALLVCAQQTLEASYQPPVTGTQTALAHIWQSALETDSKIGINNDFFQVGGHSLLAMKVVGQINEKFAIQIGLRDLFEFKTIALLADFVEQCQQSAGPGAEAKIAAVASDETEGEMEEFEL